MFQKKTYRCVDHVSYQTVCDWSYVEVVEDLQHQTFLDHEDPFDRDPSVLGFDFYQRTIFEI